jgi:hypothetical protein
MLQQSKRTTNLAYFRALTEAKAINPQKLIHIENMKNKMKVTHQTKNIVVTFKSFCYYSKRTT